MPLTQIYRRFPDGPGSLGRDTVLPGTLTAGLKSCCPPPQLACGKDTGRQTRAGRVRRRQLPGRCHGSLTEPPPTPPRRTLRVCRSVTPDAHTPRLRPQLGTRQRALPPSPGGDRKCGVSQQGAALGELSRSRPPREHVSWHGPSQRSAARSLCPPRCHFRSVICFTTRHMSVTCPTECESER